MSEKENLSASECAERYQVSTAQWRKMVANNEAPSPITVGRKKLWPIESLFAWEDDVVAELDATQEQMLSAG